MTTSSTSDDDVIDVVSHAPRVADDDDDDDDASDTRTADALSSSSPQAYRAGRLAVPMHSPGDDLLADQHLPSAGMPRLPRLRNRVFFQDGEGDESDGIGGASRSRRRVLFRRRKRQDGDVFWTAIFMANVLSLAVLGCLVVYLTQTDFFASHQSDLLGTTVDNRFTVVSQQDARAKIYLKSGYSNSRYSEAMIAFGDGILQLGRRALASTDVQRFYGLSLSHNGSAAFTNRVAAPSVATDYLHAGKAVVFEDGTVMTTAANLSGGVKEVGDLNLVSASGSVVASAGGKPVLIVEPQGFVAFPSADADDPRAMGVVVDAAGGRISIGGSFSIDHNANTSAITTAAQALHVNATRVVFGSTSVEKVTLTVPRPLKNDKNDDDKDDDDDDDDDDDSEELASASTARPSVKPTNLAIVGQSSSSQSVGGDVWIAGGDGLDKGGNVVIAGGVGLDLEELRIGSVAINAQLDPTGESFTEIGTQGGAHHVYVQGNIQLNGNKSSTDNSTQVSVAGAAFSVQAKKVTISNAADNTSSVKIDSNDVRIGESALTLEIGSMARSALKLQATAATIDAAESIAIGETAAHVTIGGSNHAGQSVNMVSGTWELVTRVRICLTNVLRSLRADSIKISSSHTRKLSETPSFSRRSLGRAASDTSMEISDIEITNGSVSVSAKHLGVGESGKTTSITLAATGVVAIGAKSLNSSVEVDGKVFSVGSGKIELGAEDSAMSISGDTVSIDASDSIKIGEDADSVEIGGSAVAEVIVEAQTVHTKGAVSVSGKSLRVNSTAVVLGGEATSKISIGDQITKATLVDGQSVEIGANAKTVAIGSASPEVSIGSTNGVIELRGKVKLNGNALESRRLSGADGSWFGYLNADPFAVDVSGTRAEFAVPFGLDRFVSSESVVEFGEDQSVAAFQMPSTADTKSGHVRLTLALDSVRLLQADEQADRSSSKLRCRVQQVKAGGLTFVALETSGRADHCVGSACESGVFFGVSSERVVRFEGGDRFYVQCLVESSAARGSLLVGGAQLAFTKL